MKKKKDSIARTKADYRTQPANFMTEVDKDVIAGYVALSNAMLDNVHKTCLRGQCNQVKARSVAMRQCSHANFQTRAEN